jgi:Domain of unknown function (DUF4476)
MQAKWSVALMVITALALSACSSGSDDKKNGGNGKPNALNWESVPSEYNPKVSTTEGPTTAKRIKLNVFGSENVELVYTNEIAPGHLAIRSYYVWAKKAVGSYLDFGSPYEFDYNISMSGSYQCSIQVRNGSITALEGGCYVKWEVLLPPGSEIEVYNSGKLISQRFIAMTNAELVQGVDRASWSNEKFQVIEDYLNSYRATGRGPSLSANELGKVVDEFWKTDEKYTVLRKLHGAVYDRENLLKMIEDEFNHFEQEEARRICGI